MSGLRWHFKEGSSFPSLSTDGIFGPIHASVLPCDFYKYRYMQLCMHQHWISSAITNIKRGTMIFFSWVQYAFLIFVSVSTHPKHMQFIQLNTNMKFSCNLCIHFSLLCTARAVLSMLICISYEICITDYKMITSFLIAFKFFTSIRVKII